MMATLFWSSVTVLAYLSGILVQRLARGSSLAHPVLVAIVLVVMVLGATGMPYETYLAATWPLTWLLAPATVALGIPLAQNLSLARQGWLAVTVGLVAGGVGSMVAGVLLVKLCGGSDTLALAMLPKSATSPIAIAVAGEIGGDPGLSAALAIVGGVIAAACLVGAMRWMRIEQHPAIGLAAGTAGSGVGTARAAQISPIAAAFAALGIGLNGLLTALLSPLVAALV